MIKGIGINCHDEEIDGHLERLAADLEQARMTGFDAYELSLTACNVIRHGQVIYDEVEQVAQALARQSLKYTLHLPNTLRLTDRTGLHQRVFGSCLEVAHRLGAEVVVYHSAQLSLYAADQDPGPLPDLPTLTDSWLRETLALREFARRAERLGVIIAIENRDPHLWEIAALTRHGKSPGKLLTYHQGMRLDLIADQVRQVGSPNVGMCLDVGHAFLAAPYWALAGLGDYLTQIRASAPWVRHVHWHDNFGRLDDRAESLAARLVFGEADNHLPPGWGGIPLAEVLTTLLEVGYGGWLTVEIRSRYAHLLPEIPGVARGMIRRSINHESEC